MGTTYLIGTGFSAYYNNTIWTNAHIVKAINDIYYYLSIFNPKPIVVKSRTKIGEANTYILSGYNIHPSYNETTTSPDIAFVYIDGEFPNFLEFLPKEYTAKLKVGQPIGTFGFPGEIAIFSSNITIATFKDGTISAQRPYNPFSQVSNPTNNHFIQHNLDLSGGTSGSPIFDHYGFVIAINNSGTESLVFDFNTLTPQRIPSGNIGFGIRIDEAWDWIESLSKSSLSKNAIKYKRFPSDFEYNPFPPNWNGKTILP